MNYLGIEYKIKNKPLLDESFVPFGVWMEAYLKEAEHPFRWQSSVIRALFPYSIPS